jgi:hypothetical protein
VRIPQKDGCTSADIVHDATAVLKLTKEGSGVDVRVIWT